MFEKLQLPGLENTSVEIYFSKENHSKQKNHRLQNRQFIAQHLKQQGFVVDPNILDLSCLPTHPEMSISLSHSTQGSVIAFAKKEVLIGVDLEEAARITEPVVTRVSTDSERQQTPDIRYLFVGKEAAWKALSHRYALSVIPEVELKDWQPLSPKAHTFSIVVKEKKLEAKGTVLPFDESLLAWVTL